jgi:hypothetical protein
MRMNRKLGYVTITAIATVLLLTFYLLDGRGSADQAGGSREVTRIAAFTLEGCGSCSKTLNELNRLEAEFTQYGYDRYSILEDSDIVNRYAVVKHPTVLFLNEQGHELGRLEQEVDAAAIKHKLAALAEVPIAPVASNAIKQAEAPARSQASTIYLMDASGGYLPVTQYNPVATNVQYPKVAAMRQLFELQGGSSLPDSLINPIPDEVAFVQIRSDGDVTVIELSEHYEAWVGTETGSQIESLIAHTLASYGVEQLRVVTVSHHGTIIDAAALHRQHAGGESHAHHATADSNDQDSLWTPSSDTAALYSAAILHREALSYLPCFCGCQEAGHRSNWNCYFSESALGGIIPTPHAENCQMCLNITETYLDERAKGSSLPDIRQIVEHAYPGLEGTDTPRPS